MAYSVVEGGHTCCDPDTATPPIPGSTVALDAPVDDHVNVVHAPCWIEGGVAEIVAVGAGGGGGAGAGGGGGGGGAWALTGHSALALAITSFAIGTAPRSLHPR